MPDPNTALYKRTAKVAWTDMGRSVINAFGGSLRPHQTLAGTLGDFKGIADKASKFASTYRAIIWKEREAKTRLG